MRFNSYVNGSYGFGGIGVSGGVMTLPLKIQNPPTAALHAVNRGYVNTASSSFDGATITGVFSAGRLPAYTGADVSSAGGGVFVLSNTGVAAGSYAKVTVNNKGRVTAGGVLLSTDIPNLSWNKVVDRPTTLSGYGITDVVSLNGGVMTGALSLNAVPSADAHLVNKGYVDTRVSGAGGSAFVTGDIVSKSSTVVPAGFLRCNGGAVSRTTYAALFAVIGNQYVVTGSVGGGQPWRNQYDFNVSQVSALGSWATTTAMPVAFGNCRPFTTKNRVYVRGEPGGFYTAVINANGTLGTWTVATGDTSINRYTTPVVFGNYVFFVGGFGAGGIAGQVVRATINTDGTIGSFTAVGAFPESVYGGATIISGNKITYIGGGTPGPVNYSLVRTATISSGGLVGPWVESSPLPVGIIYGISAVTKDRVYLISGFTEASNSSSGVYTAPILANGTIGVWTTAVSIPAALFDSTVAVTKSRIFLFGGHPTPTAVTNLCYTAPINIDGTIGSWSSASALPLALSRAGVFVTSSALYHVGGYNDVSGYVSNVYSVAFSGGLNDYSTLIPAPSGTDFTLPDLTLKDAPGFFSYIKF